MPGRKRKFNGDSSDLHEELDSSSDRFETSEDGHKFKNKRSLLSRCCSFFKGISVKGFLQSKNENRNSMQCRKRKIEDDSSDLCKELKSSTDAVLRTEDGNAFKVNTYLLAGHSPFFKALFSGNFGDGTDVLLREIGAETLRSILVYMKTGTIHLNEKNATDILVASDYLLIDSLLEETRPFVLTSMTPTNCVSLFLTARRIERLGILHNCHRFIVIRFEEVVSRSKNIGCLPMKGLKEFLTDKSLNVSNERTVWNVIVRWVKFDFPDRLQFVPELLKCISFEDVDELLVKDIISHKLIQKNKFCQELISSQSQPTEQLQNFRQILKSQSNMSGLRIPTNIQLIVYNSKIYEKFEKNIYLTADGEVDYWKKVGNIHFFPDYLIQMGNCVYMFDTTINISLAFDIFHKKCLPLTPIYEYRNYFSVVSVNGFIYILGGMNKNFNRIEDIERFDCRTGEWKLVTRMVPMTVLKAVALNGYIYAIGYNKDYRNLKMMVQVYDPVFDRWTLVSAPTVSKAKIAAIAFHGHLYLISGKTLRSVPRYNEEYDPVKDVWIPMPDLPYTFRTPGAVVLKDVLIVYEEYPVYGSDDTLPVYWDPENRTWHIIQESSPLRMIRFFRFCTIAEENIVRDIVKKNRQESKLWSKSPLA